MTAPTPPLVDVIAEVLAYENCKRVNPKADDPIFGYHTFSESQREFLRDVQMDAARAVLAALETVGGVEWGVEYGSVFPYASEAEAREQLGYAQMDVPAVLVSRIAAGPWTEVAG